jgi:hypothetical protein
MNDAEMKRKRGRDSVRYIAQSVLSYNQYFEIVRKIDELNNAIFKRVSNPAWAEHEKALKPFQDALHKAHVIAERKYDKIFAKLRIEQELNEIRIWKESIELKRGGKK